MTPSRIQVYTTRPCSFCLRAKMLLDARGLEYEEIELPRTLESRRRLMAIDPAARTFPQIVIDGIAVGGYEELVTLDRAGELVSGS